MQYLVLVNAYIYVYRLSSILFVECRSAFADLRFGGSVLE
jgi:hypothetical protein